MAAPVVAAQQKKKDSTSKDIAKKYVAFNNLLSFIKYFKYFGLIMKATILVFNHLFFIKVFLLT